MAARNYNVRHITNYDLLEEPVIENYEILVPERDSQPPHEIHFITETVPYKIAVTGKDIVKLGYCCSPNGIIYPIILTINGDENQIFVGKECMFEFQPEQWEDINAEVEEEKTSDVIVTEVKVPADIKFTLEYVTEY